MLLELHGVVEKHANQDVDSHGNYWGSIGNRKVDGINLEPVWAVFLCICRSFWVSHVWEINIDELCWNLTHLILAVTVHESIISFVDSIPISSFSEGSSFDDGITRTSYVCVELFCKFFHSWHQDNCTDQSTQDDKNGENCVDAFSHTSLESTIADVLP